jgi:hypothetical protein
MLVIRQLKQTAMIGCPALSHLKADGQTPFVILNIVKHLFADMHVCDCKVRE